MTGALIYSRRAATDVDLRLNDCALPPALTFIVGTRLAAVFLLSLPVRAGPEQSAAVRNGTRSRPVLWPMPARIHVPRRARKTPG